ncbi:MAG: hypothetical protein N2319_07810 [Candidatus Kapabacteria bacterium]|nr:hypothetical protein [Candidatus Kapabacteria bacterium]
MKTLIKIFIFLISFHILSAEVVIVEEVKEGGTRYWNDNPTFACWWPGNDCKITRLPIIDQNSIEIVSLQNGGYSLTGKFYWIGLESVGVSPQKKLDANFNGFTFLEDEYRIKVVESIEFPELNNISVKLDGIILNSQGFFTVYFPPVY